MDYSESDSSLCGETEQAPHVEKSVHTPEYSILLEMLRESRRKARLTQVQMAKELNKSQSFVSKCERGEDRIDVVQLRVFCHAMGISLPRFIAKYEKRLSQRGL